MFSMIPSVLMITKSSPQVMYSCEKMLTITFKEGHDYEHCSGPQLALRTWAKKLYEKGTFTSGKDPSA